MMKEIIDEFIWGVEQTDIPTGFEQYTTALEKNLIPSFQRPQSRINQEQNNLYCVTSLIISYI